MLRLVIVVLASAAVSVAVNILITLRFGPEVGLIAAVPGGWLIGVAAMQLAIDSGFVR